MDISDTPHIDIILKCQAGSQSSRQERCRVLVRERKGVQRSVLGEMAALLPVSQEVVGKADPRTVLRLAL